MNNSLRRALPLVFAFCASLSLAQVGTPPGEYIYGEGGGTLTVMPSGRFDITTMGANAHMCALSGTIVRGQAKLADSTCVVNFNARGNEIDVSTNGSDQCRESCGARAGFEGLYSKPTAACTNRAVAASRKSFKRQYDAKDYAGAQATLAPVLSGCEKTLDWISKGWIRNDLALSQLRGGDRAACLKTLAPLAEDAAKSDDAIQGAYPPADADSYLPIVKATRTNLKLCRG